MTAQGRAASGDPSWRRHAGDVGGLVLTSLDAGVYLISTLALRPGRCSAPQLTTPVLDCFWNNLGASLSHLLWIYIAISLAVPLAVGLLLAGRSGGSERGALAGAATGLLGSGYEALLLVGIVVYEVIAVATRPGAAGCTPGLCCAPLTSVPGLVQVLLIALGTIIITVVLFRALAGLAAGALGGWLGRRLPRPRRALTRPAHP